MSHQSVIVFNWCREETFSPWNCPLLIWRSLLLGHTMHRRQKPSTPEHKKDFAAHGGALSMSHNDTRSFFNFSQLVLSAGNLKSPPVLKHSKITYFEVEILDVQSKKQICILDKVSVLFQHAGAVPGSHSATSGTLFSLCCGLILSRKTFILFSGRYSQLLVSHNPWLFFSRIFTNNPRLVSFRLPGCSVDSRYVLRLSLDT